MKPRPHVLFILEYFYPHIGGVETLFLSLVKELDRQGYEVTVITNRYDSSLPKTEMIGSTTIKRYSFINRYFFTFLAWIPAIRHARMADIIHTTSFNAAVPARIAAKLTGTKSIITFHELWGDLWKTLPWISGPARVLFRYFEKWIAGLRFDKFVAVSDYTRRCLIAAGVPKERVLRIYNGIEYEGWPKQQKSSNDNDMIDFLFFGRPSYAKGVDILLDAIDRVVENNLKASFTLILPSEKTPILRDVLLRIDKHKEAVTIKHDLSFDQLKQEIAESDAVIIPSYSEGFCYAAVETMAIGTPIISSGKGALEEVVGGRHITMATHDGEGLYDAINRTIDAKWEEVPATQFELSDTVSTYITLYSHLLSK